MDVPLALATDAQVAPGPQQWEFHYTALSFWCRDARIFKYRLDGFDKGWIDAGHRRTAYYTRLPPGTYTFRVIASNNDGVWSDAGREPAIHTQAALLIRQSGSICCARWPSCSLSGAWYRLRVGRLRRLAGALGEQVAWRTADLELANAELLQAKERAELADKAKSRVPRQHEPRNPHAHERRDRHDGPACSRPIWIGTQRDHTETIRDSAAGLLTIINDILDFSKIEAGKLDLERIDMDLRDTVDDVAHLLAIQAHAKGLELITNVDPLLPDRVIGDPGRLRQVLLNLGSNAIKFTRDGEVTIDLRLVSQRRG